MNESAKDCVGDTVTDTEVRHLDELFLEKEELVSKYTHEVDQPRDDSSSIDQNLRILRTEILRLMQSDIQLWKKLQELDALLVVVKEDILQQHFGNAFSDKLSSASSGTESFVSAEEYNDVTFSVPNENRVKLWIDNSDFRNSVYTEKLQNYPNHKLRFEAFSDIDVNKSADWFVQENLHKSYIIDQLLKSFRISKSVSNKKKINKKFSINYLQDLLTSNVQGPTSFVEFRKPLKMKSIREIEISRQNITYYKSSLRLLGSIRMQSRIFEPSLTKWRPFALSNTSDSFIIVPPSTFSNIQPRPKLHRLPNVSENDRAYLKALLFETQETPGDRKCEEDKIYRKEIINETDISENNLITSCNKAEEHIVRSSQEICDVNNGFIEIKNDSGEAAEVSVGLDLFSFDFLELKDGLITCRILIPGIDEDLKEPVLDQGEFEYLKIKDGLVTFTPHEKDTESENLETYFLEWLFEDKYDDDESYYIHKLFEETNDEEETGETGSIAGYLYKDVNLECCNLNDFETNREEGFQT